MNEAWTGPWICQALLLKDGSCTEKNQIWPSSGTTYSWQSIPSPWVFHTLSTTSNHVQFVGLDTLVMGVEQNYELQLSWPSKRDASVNEHFRRLGRTDSHFHSQSLIIHNMSKQSMAIHNIYRVLLHWSRCTSSKPPWTLWSVNLLPYDSEIRTGKVKAVAKTKPRGHFQWQRSIYKQDVVFPCVSVIGKYQLTLIWRRN